jgi:hypothetical protein
MKKNNILLATLLLLLSTVLQAVPTDYMVMRWSEQAGLVVDYHQVVDLPLNKFVKASEPNEQSVTLMGHNGEKVWVPIKRFQHTRSEHHGVDHIDGLHIKNEELVFVVRVAKGWTKTLSFSDENSKSLFEYDWQQLVTSADKKGPQHLTKAISGGQDNRINLLFLGDGYTSGQQNAYNQDVDDVISYMQTFEPYLSYSQFLSFDRLFVASTESGADKPPACFTPSSFANTALDATYCTSNIRRLLTVNGSKVYTAAAGNPDWDEIVVIVNDDEYGGAGGGFSTISTNALATDIFIHEYGHAFTDLADEYDSPYPGYPNCSDVNGPACEANVTDVATRNDLKWSYFVAQSTPVPTPVGTGFDHLTGLFEGARYQSSGMYRPLNSCNMRSLGSGFCEVCQEAYVFKVFDVNYADGGKLSLIEPDTMMPANPNPDGMVSVPMNFSVDALQPSHDLEVSWLVNNISQSSSNSSAMTQSFMFTPTQAGMTSVKVQIKDYSPMVHSSRHNELPTFEHEWLVDVQPFNDLIFENGFEQ